MKINLGHTRDKYWEKGNLYILPTIRYEWKPTYVAGGLGRKVCGYNYWVSLIWLFIKVEVFWTGCVVKDIL